MGYFIYFPFIWKQVYNNVPYWILFASVLVFPIISVGYAHDFGWRLTIPFTFYNMILVLRNFGDWHLWCEFKKKLFVIVICIGSIDPICIYAQLAYGQMKNIHKYQLGRVTDMPTVIDNPEAKLRSNFVSKGESIFTKILLSERGCIKFDTDDKISSVSDSDDSPTLINNER